MSGTPLEMRSGGVDVTVRSTATVAGTALLIANRIRHGWVRLVMTPGHGLVDRVTDESLQVAPGRCRQVVAADCGRGFGDEDA